MQKRKSSEPRDRRQKAEVLTKMQMTTMALQQRPGGRSIASMKTTTRRGRHLTTKETKGTDSDDSGDDDNNIGVVDDMAD